MAPSSPQSEGVNVLALDPGEKVGWARATVMPDATWTDLQHGITPLQDMALAVGKRLDDYDVLVVESFRLAATKSRSMIGSDLPTVQFIGMCRYLAWVTPTVRLVLQAPAIKRTVDKTAPEWLQEIIANEPKSHDDAHNVDALRHLWHWTWLTKVANAE